jgi:DNA-binding transcriptional LysR family regulator
MLQESFHFLEANKYLIRYYYVYKYKSFHRASENFYIAGTDRNMKYAVTQLESFYGLKLVNIEGNKLGFTEFGHILGSYSQRIFDLNVEINSNLQRLNLKEVRFASTHDFYKYYIKSIFDVFLKKNNDLKVTVIKTNQYDSIQRLLSREIDFVVGTTTFHQNQDLSFQEIANANILLAVKEGRKNEFTGIKKMADLLKFKGATYDNTDPFFENFYKCQEENEIELNIIYQSSDFDSLIDSLKDDIVDYAIVGNYANVEGIHFIDISSFFYPVVISIIYRKGEPTTEAIEEWIKIALDLKIAPMEIKCDTK